MNNIKRIRLLTRLLEHILQERPLPWICERGEGQVEVKTADGVIVAGFKSQADADSFIALAEDCQRELKLVRAIANGGVEAR